MGIILAHAVLVAFVVAFVCTEGGRHFIGCLVEVLIGPIIFAGLALGMGGLILSIVVVVSYWTGGVR